MIRYGKRICIFIFVWLAGLAFTVSGVCAQPEETLAALKAAMDGIYAARKADYDPQEVLLSNEEILSHAGSSGADWMAFAAARCGYPEDYDAYLTRLEDFVVSNIDTLRRSPMATDLQRMALTIAALGGDPTDVNGIDLLQEGVYGREKPLSAQGLNALIFGLLTLDAVEAAPPAEAGDVRTALIGQILQGQMADGGFTLNQTSSDADITAMALCALAPYRTDSREYETANGMRTVGAAIEAALSRLSALQTDSGSFAPEAQDSMESTAQVLIALSTLGIDCTKDARFIKNGKTALDALMGYRCDSGGFAHSRGGEENPMSSVQAWYALCACYRCLKGAPPLYDLREAAGSGAPEGVLSAAEAVPAGSMAPAEGEEAEPAGGKTIVIFVVLFAFAAAAAGSVLYLKHRKQTEKHKSYEDKEEW